MENQEKKYDLVKFGDGELSLDVMIRSDSDTVWLNREQLSILFERDIKTIGKHINNILNEELNNSVVAKFAHTATDGKTYNIEYYDLDMITMIGYRIKSNRIITFEKWANEVLRNIKNKNSLTKPLIVFKHGDISLDVTVSPDEDTVWLSKEQIATLYETTRQNIEYHISNIYEQNELEIGATCKEILHFTDESTRYKYRTIQVYNLDMIISLGYRINTKNGIIFRKWATSVLKNYLLNGHVINEDRCLSCTSNIISLQNEVKNIESKINSIEDRVNIENSKIFYQGEILEAYSFIRKLFFLAKKEIIVIDFYADKFLLDMLTDIKVNITIITSTSSYLNKETIPSNIRIITNDDIHGRYLFIDNTGYIIDNSFNNIGKKRILMMKLEDSKERILKGII